MDRLDKKILGLLQADGKMSNQELAEKVALSPSPCLRRVKHLEKQGYIRKYVALLDPEKLGLQLTVLVSVGLSTHAADIMKNFEEAVQSFPEVVQCDLMAGQAQDYLLKVMMTSLQEYQAFLLDRLTQIEGVKNVHSSFVLRSIIDKSALPLGGLG